MTTCPFRQRNDYKIDWEATTFSTPKPLVDPKPNTPSTDDDLVAVRYKD